MENNRRKVKLQGEVETPGELKPHPGSTRASSFRCVAAILLIPLLLCVAAGADNATPELLPLEGEPFAAELIDIEQGGQARFQAADEERSFALADLVFWGAPVEAAKGPQLLFPDGGVLIADVLKVSGEQLQVDSPLFGPLAIPLEQLSAVLFYPPSDPQLRDEFINRLLAATGNADRLLMENGDELPGTLLGLDETSFQWTAEVGEIKIETERVRAVAFNPGLVRRVPHSGLRTLVGLNDGSRLTAASLKVGGTEAVFQVLGQEHWTTARGNLIWLQPLGGRAMYLSDLTAASYRHVPFLQLPWDYRRDRNVLGTQLRSGGRHYAKGLGMHSTSRLTYKLDRPYRRFQAELALDDQVGPRGSVTFRVFVDNQQKYASPIVRGNSPHLPISIDISGAKTISLIVDFAERGDELDHANWLNARVVE